MFVFKEQRVKVPGAPLDTQDPVVKETACHIDWEEAKWKNTQLQNFTVLTSNIWLTESYNLVSLNGVEEKLPDSLRKEV